MEDVEGLRARVHGFVRPPRLADCAGRHAEHAGLRRSGADAWILIGDGDPVQGSLTDFIARQAGLLSPARTS